MKNKSKQPRLLGSHQRCWVWGRYPVMEILEAGRWKILELHLAEELGPDELKKTSEAATQRNIPVYVESSERLVQLGHAPDHQGYLAKMSEYSYASLDEILKRLKQTQPPPLLAILDSIQDPYNFGSIVRSAEVLGVDAILIGEENQVGVTSHVARSSAGAVNRIPIARVSDLLEMVVKLKGLGIIHVAATEKASLACSDFDFNRPVAILLGNEANGIRPDLLAICDTAVRIPQSGGLNSLNVAAAAAVIFYEARRQQEQI